MRKTLASRSARPISSAPMRIEGAGALVAGGASGLGAATARSLATAGARVVIVDRDPERGAALAEEIGAAVRRGRRHRCRLRSRPRSSRRRPSTEGCGSRSAAPGSAGPSGSSHKAGAHNLEYFSNVIEVNLIGTFNVLRLAATAMSDNEPDDGGERGVCVNTASIAAFDGQIGQIAYAASKGGIVGMTLPAARDIASRGDPGGDDRTRPLRHTAARGTAGGGARRRSAPASPSPRASAGPRSTRSWSSRSSPTRCSTARRSASTGRCGCRRVDHRSPVKLG